MSSRSISSYCYPQTLMLICSGALFFYSVLGHGIICFQISEDHFMFNTTISQCNGPHCLGLFWKNLIGVQRALTSTPFSTFRIKWNTIYEPGLFTRHQRPTSLMLLWLNGSKSLKPVANSDGKSSHKSGVVEASWPWFWCKNLDTDNWCSVWVSSRLLQAITLLL